MAGIGGARRAGPRGRSLAARAALALAIVCALAGSWPATADAQGSAMVEVTLHSAGNYGGASWSSYFGTASLVGPGFNDIASSITVPPGGRVAVFEHTNYGGRCEDFTASDPDLRDNLIGNDRISSLKVGQACPVRLFADPNYLGGYKDVRGDVPDLRGLGFDDSATAMIVPAGTKVAVYEHPNYAGLCEEITASDPDLRDNPIGDDRITSLRVGQGCPRQVAFFTGTNYSGDYRVLTDADGDGVASYVGDFWWYRLVKSIHLADGTPIEAWYLPVHGSGCEYYAASDPDLSDNVIRVIGEVSWTNTYEHCINEPDWRDQR